MATGSNIASTPAVGGGITQAQSSQLMLQDKRSVRRKTLLLGALLLAAVLLSLGISVTQTGSYSTPAEVAACYARWLKVNIGGLFNPAWIQTLPQIAAELPMYGDVCSRAARTLVSLEAGALLALSGMLYQNVFRNPIAAPTMLGVSSGISLGVLALVYLYGTAATTLVGTRYLYSFIGGCAVLAVVIGAGRFIGGARGFSLVDMLLVGSILSSIIGTVVTYVTNYVFTDAQWEVYFDLNNVTSVETSGTSLIVITAAFALCLLPVVLLRFRLNVIALSEEDIRMLGVSPAGLRAVALGCGSVMIMVAQMFAGTVSMVSLVVPFATRALYGSEFRRQIWGNVLMGALILVLCRDLVDLIPFVGDGIPLGTMVSFVMLPAFAWVMAYGSKQFGRG